MVGLVMGPKTGMMVVAGLLSALLLSVAVTPAAAQDPGGTPTVNDVASELYCPLCAGLTVDVCELEVCDDMRGVIAERLAAGESPEQIKEYFVEQYGQKVLAKPATTGFDLTAWLVPFLALAAGAALLVAWLRQRPTVAPSRAPARAPSDEEYHALLERELRRRE